MLKITGADLSFTSSGVSRLVLGDPRPPIVARIVSKQRGTLTRDQWYMRLNYQHDQVMNWCAGADLVVIEGPAFARPQGQHQLGGLWYKVTDSLWHLGIPFIVITPTSLKKYVLGKGSGPGTDKDHVLAAVIRRYPMVMVSGNDEADALALAAMCADWYGHPVAEVPKGHRTALDSVEWIDPGRLGLAS